MSTTLATPEASDALSDFTAKHYSDGSDSAAPESGQDSGETQAANGATDGEAGTDPAQADQDSQAEADGAEAAGTDPAAEATGDLEALIQQFAKETGLDPNDPAQRKTLNRLASKEAHIHKLAAENAQLSAKLNGDGSDQLTEYEREQLKAEETAEGDGKPKQADAEPTRATQAEAKPWRTPQDLYTEEAQAYQSGDFDKIHDLQVRKFDFMLEGVLPALDKRFNALIEQRFGDVMPTVRDAVAREQRIEAQQFALEQVEKLPGYESVRDLYKVEDGPKVVIKGKEYPNSPINRLMRDFPELTLIQGRDAKETFIVRFKAAMRIQKAAQVDKPKAQALVQAGQQLEKRAAQDKARQGLNAGSGASGRGEGASDDYISQLRSSGASRTANL